MATFTNYNIATFRDRKAPNRRKLQELQTSEARAHAARVSYWRKHPKRANSDLEYPTASTEAATCSEIAILHHPFPELQPRRDATPVDRAGSSESRDTLENYVETVARRDSTSAASSSLSSSGSAHSDRWSFSRLEEVLRRGTALSRPPPSSMYDPLDSIPIPHGHEVSAAMDHFINIWAPSQRPRLQYQTRDNPLINTIFPSALQNVELFEAAVALCLSFKAAGSGFQSRLCNFSLYHKGQALAALRQKLLSGIVDDAVILATTFLMIIDNVFLDESAYEAHLIGLRKMVQARGDTDSSIISNTLRSFTSWAESNGVLILGDRVAIAVDRPIELKYPTSPIPETMIMEIDTFPSGFQRYCREGIISTNVLKLLSDTIRWATCIDEDQTQTLPEEDYSFLHDFDPRANSAVAMTLARLEQSNTMETIICKAVFVFHAHILGWTCRCSGYKRLVAELASAIFLAEVNEQSEQDFWLWIGLSTSNAARRGGQQQLRAALVSQLLIWEKILPPWASVEPRLKKFLWHSKLMREWKFCWDAIVATYGPQTGSRRTQNNPSTLAERSTSPVIFQLPELN